MQPIRVASASLALAALLGVATCREAGAPAIGDRSAAFVLATQPAIAFGDVTVVPMDADRESPHQTVVARNGRIVAIGNMDAVAVPPGAIHIDRHGNGFLIPGLADTHVHILVNDEIVLNIANGVTTVRNLHGVPGHLAWRDSIARGLKFGPRLYTSGPIVDGSPPARSTSGATIRQRDRPFMHSRVRSRNSAIRDHPFRSPESLRITHETGACDGVGL